MRRMYFEGLDTKEYSIVRSINLGITVKAMRCIPFDGEYKSDVMTIWLCSEARYLHLKNHS